nr:MAG TPA: hypothetical protein [Caudoviricetes sp.]
MTTLNNYYFVKHNRNHNDKYQLSLCTRNHLVI